MDQPVFDNHNTGDTQVCKSVKMPLIERIYFMQLTNLKLHTTVDCGGPVASRASQNTFIDFWGPLVATANL